MLNAPAPKPAKPATNTVAEKPELLTEILAETPAIRAMLETNPSMIPKTAGLNQPPDVSCERSLSGFIFNFQLI
jgi:hypothetical protein